MDSGSQQLMFRRKEFTAIAAAFKGKTIVQAETAVYFDCSIPQLLELKYHDRWFPVDPLDLIIPSDHGMKDGKELCHAALGVWDRTFADSIIGVPFLRKVVSVFDYVKFETYTIQPRLGLAGLTDAEYAMERVKWDAQNDIQDYIYGFPLLWEGLIGEAAAGVNEPHTREPPLESNMVHIVQSYEQNKEKTTLYPKS
ncbi:aspartic-type endopeptidase [Fusarium circinatum]|uniref:Aspartic-type endopeptidase n=1 Tax=Fusarium circinatum TaxID=48490 RepID=A0A8H5XE63_FUSCI|nr:aspartic-type endopeptidase [Fusarium circinatum]